MCWVFSALLVIVSYMWFELYPFFLSMIFYKPRTTQLPSHTDRRVRAPTNYQGYPFDMLEAPPPKSCWRQASSTNRAGYTNPGAWRYSNFQASTIGHNKRRKRTVTFLVFTSFTISGSDCAKQKVHSNISNNTLLARIVKNRVWILSRRSIQYLPLWWVCCTFVRLYTSSSLPWVLPYFI